MSRSVDRERTARNLRRARATYGDAHPATWAAYGRALAVWGAERIASLAPAAGNIELACVAVVASSRALTPARPNNRHNRARRAA